MYRRLLEGGRSGWAIKNQNKLLGLLAVCSVLLVGWKVPFLPQEYPASARIVEPEQDLSTYLGGTPGFHVFSGLWYRNETYYVFSDTNLPFPQDEAVDGRTSLQRLPASEVPTAFDSVPIKRFDGSSLIFNDGSDPWGPWTYFSWYYHFAAENLLGGMAALSAYTRSPHARSLWKSVFGGSDPTGSSYPAADWLFVPWKDDWRDSYGMNEFLVNRLFPKNFIDKPNWDFIAGEEAGYPWVRFERAALIDRVAAGRDPVVDATTGWNKMAITALTQSHPRNFWEDTRRRLSSSLHTRFQTRQPGRALHYRPKVVYIDRSATNRRLATEDQEALLNLLRRWDRFGKISFFLAQLEHMTHEQQVKAVSDADIMLGVHGNGLTHMLWMPPGGVVIEMFTPDTFLRDYQVPAEALGHMHITVRNDTVLQREQWEHMRPAWEALHDGTPIPLQVPFMESLLGQVVEAMTA